MKQIIKRIHAAAPVRICDIGGWTDTWFAGHGAVFNIAVTPCVEVDISVYPREKEPRITLHLDNYNDSYCLDPDNIQYRKHPLIEAGIDMMAIPRDISLDIRIFSRVPAGASVGTSAAVSVALIGALDALTPGRLSAQKIAALAHRVETEKLGLQSGIQDQLCSAHGGINYIEMDAFPHSTVSTLDVPDHLVKELQQRLALVYIGTPHNSSDIHKMVINDLGDNAVQDQRMEMLRQLAGEARQALLAGNLEELGRVMNGNTEVQRQLHPGLVCSKFEELMEIAASYHVSGCKVNGAGGDGGSITILTDGHNHNTKKLLHTLLEKNFHTIPIVLSKDGVCVSKR